MASYYVFIYNTPAIYSDTALQSNLICLESNSIYAHTVLIVYSKLGFCTSKELLSSSCFETETF
jgi:hypothetical protein